MVVLSLWIYFNFFYIKPVKLQEKVYMEFGGYTKERHLLSSFVKEHFLQDGFFRTNLLDNPQIDLASGEDFLSESLGLLMLFYLKEDNLGQFEGQVELLQTFFFNKNRLIKWRIRPGQVLPEVNAPLDDMRIIKALIMAHEKWGRKDFLSLAQELSDQLLRHSVDGKNLLAFDSKDSPKAPFVYYDFEALALMALFHDRWAKILRKNISFIAHHQIKGRPFYHDPWFSQEKGYPMIENLMIFMHFSEVGVRDESSIQWLKEKLHGDGLFGLYSKGGRPLNTIESPAIYAIVAIIGKLNQDEELYRMACERLRKMQILGCGLYSGGFVDLETLSAYSFDHLFSLLAY